MANFLSDEEYQRLLGIVGQDPRESEAYKTAAEAQNQAALYGGLGTAAETIGAALSGRQANTSPYTQLAEAARKRTAEALSLAEGQRSRAVDLATLYKSQQKDLLAEAKSAKDARLDDPNSDESKRAREMLRPLAKKAGVAVPDVITANSAKDFAGQLTTLAKEEFAAKRDAAKAAKESGIAKTEEKLIVEEKNALVNADRAKSYIDAEFEKIKPKVSVFNNPLGADQADIDAFNASLFPQVKKAIGEKMTDADAKRLIDPFTISRFDNDERMQKKMEGLKRLIDSTTATPTLERYGQVPKTAAQTAVAGIPQGAGKDPLDNLSDADLEKLYKSTVGGK